MKEKQKTKDQLIKELRARITKLEKLENDRNYATEAVQESEEKYRSLVESTEDSIYLVDENSKYLFMNRKHISRLGLSEDEFLGRTYGDFHSADETRLFIGKAKKVFKTGKSAVNEYQSFRDGRYFLQTLSPVKRGRKTVAVTVVSKDITERKQMEEELRALSLTDELTGLYNRRGFLTLAEQELKMANRLKRGIFMLYADVDDLKWVNDTYGHREGDRVLVETAKMLKHNYRDSDIVARIGGDEFVVIPVGTAKDSVEIITNRFHKALDSHNKKIKRRYKLSISIGIAFYDPATPCSINEFLAQADTMMYKHKRDQQRH